MSDANAPPDELEEDEWDEYSDKSTMFDQELLQPGSYSSNTFLMANEANR